MKEARLYRRLDDQKVHCNLCHHGCRIAESKFGICGVRQNRAGRLYTHAYGKVVAANVDPIEKKPLYHFLPGSTSFSVAAMGCNFQCGFCQNWQISQAPRAQKSDIPGRDLPPADIVKQAEAYECRSISYTYTEPTIFFEYACDTAVLAREAGIFNVFVTNGLRYVYLGNVAGKSVDTQCPHCLQTVVRRSGYHTTAKLTRAGECPQCGARIAGVWRID